MTQREQPMTTEMKSLALVTIPKGTTLSLGGIPVQLVNDTVVRTHEANLPLISGWAGEIDLAATKEDPQ